MGKLLKHLGLSAVLLLASIGGAYAQQVNMYWKSGTAGNFQDWQPVSAANPLAISGSFSASGFTPNGNYGTLTATNLTSASTALPAGAVVAFQNTSTVDVSCTLAAGAATAVTNQIIVRAGSTIFLTVGANDHTACINQTGSASNVIVLAGGAGLGTGFGGGSGGGGLSVTDAAAWTATVSAFTPNGGVFNDGATALTSGQQGTVRVNAHREMHVDIDNNASTNNLAALLGSGVGPTSPGTAPATSLLTGGIYNSAGVTLTNGQQAGTQMTATGAIKTASDDPCQTQTKVYKPFSLNGTSGTYTTPIVAGTASNKTYICQFFVNNNAAVTLGVVEATTATSCGTVTAGVWGGTTSATGFQFAANGGVSIGHGGYRVANTATVNDDICAITNSTTQITGGILYVQAP